MTVHHHRNTVLFVSETSLLAMSLDERDERFRAAICEWLKQHGIDPSNVPQGYAVHRDIERRQVRYTTCVLTRDGQRHRWVRPDQTIADELGVMAAVVQLEASPLPWPDPIQSLIRREGAG